MDIQIDLSSITDYLLHAQWIAWAFRFIVFYILARWVGIKWYLLIILVAVLEAWETVDWSLENPLQNAMYLDTWVHLGAGLLGIYLGQKAR